MLGLEKQENYFTKYHMADGSATSRVGRPRARSAHQTPKSTAKAGKKTTAPTKKAVRPLLQLKQDTVDANQRPFRDQLPDLPPLDSEQGDNIPLNPTNQPQDLPVGEEIEQHQTEEPNQVPNLPPEPEEPDQLEQPNPLLNQPNQPNQPCNPHQNLPVAMGHPQQVNWSYFKPEFSGKPEEDAEAHLLRTNDWMGDTQFPN